MCWTDIQKAHATLEAALAVMPANGRIMEVTPQGRRPVAP